MIAATTTDPSDVAIVGGGACGVALLVELIERAKKGTHLRTVSVFEKAKTVGPGLAYSEQCQGTKLNMRSETMGLRVAEPNDFVRWMQSTNPGIETETYLPRLQYGEYLCDLKASVKRDAGRLGVEIRSISREVVALDSIDIGFDLVTVDGEHYQASNVVLALGNFMSARYTTLKDELGYFPFPWPIERLKLISRDASVSVIGSRLTAIDVALCLHDHGHTGPITLVSRTGRLPKVQSVNASKRRQYKLFEVARDLECRRPGDSFHRAMQAIKSEVEHCSAVDWNQVMTTPPDAQAELDKDILDSETDNSNWQSVLNGTTSLVERYWACFTENEKRAFLDCYQSIWMTFRHAMPLITARRVQKLMSDGQIRVSQMRGAPKKESSGFSIPVENNNGRLYTDFIVEATGPECNALKVPSKLLHNCLGSGLLKADPFGGVKVDPHSLEASPGLSIIGSLTRGTHLYSMAIDRNVAHADRIVSRICDEPNRRPLHIAFFVGTDLCSQLMVSEIVPRLINCGHMPYVFLPAHKASKRATKFELRELAFFERQLLQDHVIPAVRDRCSGSSPRLTVDQLSERYGILVQKVPNVNDPAFLDELSSHHIDVGMSIRCYQKFGKEIIRFFHEPRCGLLNLHPGALPQYRGVMTTIRAMANRERDFGYSLHSINEDWDAGDLIDIQSGPINYKLAMLPVMTELYPVGVKVALEAFEKISRSQKLPSVPQNEAQKGYYTFPTRDELDEYSEKGLRLVDAQFMQNFMVSSFSSSQDQDYIDAVVQQAIKRWYIENVA